jgi:hypothetical protein
MNAKDRLRGLQAWSMARVQEAARAAQRVQGTTGPAVLKDALRSATRAAGRTFTIVVDAVRERGSGDGTAHSHEPDDPGAPRKP